jgi:hypothetical protein
VGPVSDEFLLTTASIAATLVGLLLLGGFFYLETGLNRAAALGSVGKGFLRATVKFTLLLYSLVLVVSLGSVVLRPGWLAVAFAAVSLAYLASLLEWTARYRELRRVVSIPWESTWLTWAVSAVLLVLPWAVGGLVPDRGALTWSLLLAGALALQSTAGLLLTSFDLAELDEDARRSEDGQALRGR